jgi:hypothetical protein
MNDVAYVLVIAVALRFLGLFLPWRLPSAGFAYNSERGWHWFAHGLVRKEG